METGPSVKSYDELRENFSKMCNTLKKTEQDFETSLIKNATYMLEEVHKFQETLSKQYQNDYHKIIELTRSEFQLLETEKRQIHEEFKKQKARLRDVTKKEQEKCDKARKDLDEYKIKFDREIEDKTNQEMQKINAQYATLNQEKQHFEDICAKLKKVSFFQDSKVHLNVGGTVFVTTVETLMSVQGTLLYAMCTQESTVGPDRNGEIFIDRSPKFFSLILDYLRTPNLEMTFEDFTWSQVQEIEKECEFYQLDGLKKMTLKKKKFFNLF